MELTEIREMLSQVQTSARVTTAIGEPVSVGERVIVPVAEVMYAGGGGGGGGKSADDDGASGGGGGGGVRVRPLGCWVVGPTTERWVPAVDVNRMALIAGAITLALVGVVRAFARR